MKNDQKGLCEIVPSGHFLLCEFIKLSKVLSAPPNQLLCITNIMSTPIGTPEHIKELILFYFALSLVHNLFPYVYIP